MSKQESVEAVASFLERSLEAAGVSARAEGDRDVVVFTPQMQPGIQAGVLEVTEEALDDHAPEVILSDLREEDVPQRLLSDPTLRLRYSADRHVPHLETREVECGGRRYRVVRGGDHIVHIYDSADRALSPMPPTMLRMDRSIYRKSLKAWCDEISSWRGPEQ